MYFVQFPNNIKCFFVFWALFVKILLYLWYIFIILYLSLLACVLIFISWYAYAYMLGRTCPLKDWVNN